MLVLGFIEKFDSVIVAGLSFSFVKFQSQLTKITFPSFRLFIHVGVELLRKDSFMPLFYKTCLSGYLTTESVDIFIPALF